MAIRRATSGRFGLFFVWALGDANKTRGLFASGGVPLPGQNGCQTVPGAVNDAPRPISCPNTALMLCCAHGPTPALWLTPSPGPAHALRPPSMANGIVTRTRVRPANWRHGPFHDVATTAGLSPGMRRTFPGYSPEFGQVPRSDE